MARKPGLIATAAVTALVLSGTVVAVRATVTAAEPPARSAPTAGLAPAAPGYALPVEGTPAPVTASCERGCEFVSRPAPEVESTDARPTEVGVRTRFDRPGHVLGAALLRGAYRGPITLRLWSDGELLAERAWDHPGRMADIDFREPVPVQPGREYVVSYYTPHGGYALSEDYYTAEVVWGPFTAPRGAGVLRHGPGGGFPTESRDDSTYWVNPKFRG